MIELDFPLAQSLNAIKIKHTVHPQSQFQDLFFFAIIISFCIILPPIHSKCFRINYVRYEPRPTLICVYSYVMSFKTQKQKLIMGRKKVNNLIYLIYYYTVVVVSNLSQPEFIWCQEPSAEEEEVLKERRPFLVRTM